MVRKTKKTTAANTVSNIRRRSRKRYSGEEKIRIVLEGLRGEETVAELRLPLPGRLTVAVAGAPLDLDLKSRVEQEF